MWKFVTLKIYNRHSGVLPQLTIPPPFMLFLLCRSEMETWFVCGSWLENACLNMPPPSAPGLTARGFAGLFREELHVSWSTATTRSLIFPPYLRQPIKPGGKWVTLYAKKTDGCPQMFALIGCNFWVTSLQYGHSRTAPVIFLTDLHWWGWISLRKSSKCNSFP